MSDISSIKEVTDVWQDYRRGVEYQENIGLSKNLPIFVEFYEGKQWPAPTKRTKSLPRPVVNIIKMICRNKKSAILSSPVRLVYKMADNEDGAVDVERFNRFAAYIQRELGQDELDKRAIHDAVRKGSYFYHYYWDAEARGKDGIREGALRGEIIEPLSIFFADPTECDEQKQEWIIIATREHIKSVRAKADKGIDPNLISADENEDKYNTKEQEGDKLCTVLTRYFRKDGEVWFEKSVKSTVVNKPRPLSPDIDAARKTLKLDDDGSLDMDAPNNDLPDGNGGKEIGRKQAKAVLYPIVAGSYEPREKCIYGIGEVEGIIPNQKLINFTLGMMALAVQEQAWGKYIVHPNALQGQVITNEPGQVLIDHSNTGSGIKRMSEQAIHSIPLELVDTISNLTRVVTGSSEVMTGETLGSSMSGAAIAQLQAQAQQPNEELRDAFHIVKAKIGKVLAQFFKLYYAQKEYTYEEIINEKNGEKGIISDTFNSTEYRGVDFEVTVEATAGTRSSTAGDINILENLLARGQISLKTFINAYPEDAISNRSEIIKGIEADESSAVKTYEAQIVELQNTVAQYEAALKEAQATAEKAIPIMNENKRLKEIILSLYGEAAKKISEANSQISSAKMGYIQKSAEANEAKADASEFAQHIMQTEMVK